MHGLRNLKPYLYTIENHMLLVELPVTSYVQMYSAVGHRIH